ncbi:hypothetical protein DTL21_24060 [Bremerella cremea]|uniref:Uncharacterized protein n=1 Tax=Blastopirellula marina TaxID=124 RepID=A0A2S8FE65_9BACT|nr:MULTISPECIES: hypothetical protein [Pirellulaceae]PQO30432.1 hypothetical protein C5Y83_24015 [Blastopirellula marina]RCS43785.1 hypothetical protein DTL21_24060 [Bremerella cremea]
MTENPFESPVATTATVDADQALSAPAKRPLGISILAILSLLSGIIYLLEAGFMFFVGPIPFVSGAGVLLVSLRLIWGILALGLLGMAAAIGLWRGTKWGWWLAAIRYVYGVANSMTLLVWVFSTTFTLGAVGHNSDGIILQNGLGLILSVMFLLYLQRKNALTYFGLDQGSHVARASGLIAFGAIVLAVLGVFRLG